MKSQPETPPEHQEKNLNELPSKTFKSQEFELTIYQGERKIIFSCSEIKDLSGTLYKAELTLDELYKLNNLLRGFQSIESIFTDFFQNFDESKIIFKKEDNKITATFIIEFMGNKKEAKISLTPEKPDLNVTVMKLCKEIDLLKTEFENKIKNQIILDINRYGKWLMFELNDYYLLSHLRMEGKYFIRNKEDPKEKHEHVIFHFSDGTDLRYNDTRKFGKMYLLNKKDIYKVKPLKDLGLEPWDKKLTPSYLKNKFHKKTQI